MICNFKIELKKLKHHKIPVLIAGILLLIFNWILLTTGTLDASEQETGYFNLLYQIPIMNTILLPLFLAILASRIWDIEHKGNTLKLLCTLQKREHIYRTKSILGILLIFLLSLGEAGIILLIGNLLSFTQPLPKTHMMAFIITTFIISVLIYLFQEILTFLFENQLVALSLGLIGSFAGLFFLFFARSLQQFVIWSYYCVLQTIGMNWDITTKITNYTEQPLSLPHFFFICILIVFIYPAGKWLFLKKEI